MKAVISIVSHGDQKTLMENELVTSPSHFNVIVRENINKSKRLVSGEIEFYTNLRVAGFGANHNKNYELAKLNPDDWFVICNPDIIASPKQLTDLLTAADSQNIQLAAPMLWNNASESFDHNVRPRPSVLSLALSLVGKPAQSRYDSETIRELEHPDWASGAFLAIKSDLFKKLNGFDERYFMYMEDVDICARASRLGIPVSYFPQVRLIHNAARKNRNIFSHNFLYHLRSVLRYFIFSKSFQ